MSFFKKSSKILLGTLMVFSLHGVSSASAVETNMPETKLAFEDGSIISFGEPKIKSLETNFLAKSIDSDELKFQQFNYGDKITQSISIYPKTSNTTIEIPLTLEKGNYVKLYQDEQGETHSVGNIYNEYNESVGIIYAEVQNKEELEIKAEITNSDTLELNIEQNDLSEPIEIQVEARATFYSTYFSSGTWITRDGLISLSLTHKPYLLEAWDVGVGEIKKADAWDKAMSIHKGNANWYNAAGLKKQFDCHYAIAKFKNPWNLEPSNPNVSYAEHLAKLCNPR